MIKKPSIVCFGEVLWDVLPSGKVAGGAPMNVAYQSKSLGCEVQMISAIGNDDLGKELIAFLNKKGIPTNLIQTNYTFPTSTVQVTLNEKGSASYEIVKPVAWDFIYPDEVRIAAIEHADILLFGSLICREEYSRKTLFELIDKAQKTVFDVNLRAPFYSQPLLESLLEKADVVKVNDEELDIITGWYGLEKDIAGQMEFVREKFKIETLVMTKGKHGAFCLHNNELTTQKSFPVEVQDTVGAGDAFLAAFITKMLYGETWQGCLEFACATGALVATKSGGTPEINETLVKDFLLEQQSKPQLNNN